jgi:micrococcal nuclease
MAEAPFPVRVVKVTDGDTVHARPLSDPSVLYKVRLQGIDAPETKQDYGAESTAALNALLFPNKQVYLKTNGTDKYHRTLGTLYVKSDGKLQDVHLEMVRQGHAWTYRAYTFPPEYDVAEREARAAKRGLWASPAPQPPWEWRQEHKHHPWQRRAHRARKHYHRYVSACLEEPQEEALERTSDDPKAAYYISHLFQPKRWNRVFRQVEHTARFSQVVKMTLQSNELVPAEVHPDNDQVLICKSGEGVVTLGAADAQVNVSFKPGRLVVINAGTRHAIQALEQGVQLWSLYAPWHHPVGTVQRTNPELVAPLVPAPLIGEKCTEEQCFSHLRDPTPLGQVLGGRILFGSLKHASNSDTLREHKITHIVSTIGPPECRIKGYVYYWVCSDTQIS